MILLKIELYGACAYQINKKNLNLSFESVVFSVLFLNLMTVSKFVNTSR